MRRDADQFIDGWWDGGDTRPLVIRGVRGCGKTFSALSLAERRGIPCTYVDLGAYGADRALADTAGRVASGLRSLTGQPVPDGTLVVIDGVRGPGIGDALLELASTHRVIAVSRGLEPFGEGFADLRIRTMSFTEFLDAGGRSDLAAMLRGGRTGDAESLIPLFAEFQAVGGLPGAVGAWLSTGDEREADSAVRKVLADILDDACRRDRRVSEETVGNVMSSVPDHLSRANKKFMFSRASPGDAQRSVRTAVGMLEGIGAVLRVEMRGDAAPGAFKLFCFDTGALRVLRGAPMSMVTDPDLGGEFAKGVAENAVLLELERSGAAGSWCWRSGNKAEAELVVPLGGTDVPIQVSSGPSFYPRSLREYSRRDPSAPAVYMSPAPPEVRDGVTRVPLYAACTLRGMFGPGA